jgi:hypothetical protein
MGRLALVSIAAAVAMLGSAVQPSFSFSRGQASPNQPAGVTAPSTAGELLAQAESLPEAVRTRVLQQVAEAQNRPLTSLQVVSATPETWPDGCLGLGGPAEGCLLAMVPGWRVTVTDGNTSWTYRTGTSGEGIRQEAPEAVQTRVLQQAAQEQNRPQASLRMVNATAEEWSDSCLGLGGPAELCLQAMTPGWRVTVTDGSASWTYRTDASGQAIRQETQSEVPQYTDVEGRYAPEIAYVTSQGILVGSPQGSQFFPDRPITREELAMAIVQAMQQAPLSPADAATEAAAQLPPLPNPLATAPFRDVAANRRSAIAIQYLKGLGLIEGYPDGSFRPEQTVTRAELVSLLLKMDIYLVELRRWDNRDASNLEPAFAFSDTRGHWAARYISVMSENCRAAEPLNGEGTQFAPNAPATRGYAAAAIARDLWCLSL